MKRIFFTLLLGFSLLACSGQNVTTYEDTPVGNDLKKSDFDVNLYKLNSLICDPMGGGDGPVGLGDGLKAELYYTDGTNYDSVSEYFTNGTRLENNLFYSQLFVPTRRFELGFPTETGEMVKSSTGEELNEYFALKFSTVVKLGEDDEPGLYEFALLSDDGALIKYRNGEGQMVELVNNDGDHPTRMACSSSTIEMTKDSELVVEIDYYQGPRYHISLIPMWRKVSGERQNESSCGQQGNSLYFDYNNNSEPQQAYLNLLARDWKPLTAANYSLPVEAIFNPCSDGDRATISDFTVADNLDGAVIVKWKTNLPATSQVRVVDVETKEDFVTDADNLLRTNHSQLVKGLIVGKSYYIQAISITQSYGKTLSPIELFVPQ